jgi:hypothetical protein
MEKMKALVFHGVNDIRVDEVPRPRAGAGEAVIRVTLTTICGAVLVEIVDTICAPRYPTSYKAGAVIIGQAPAIKPTSLLFSTTYSFISLQARHLHMDTSPMMIIQAKLFRRLQSTDPLI